MPQKRKAPNVPTLPDHSFLSSEPFEIIAQSGQRRYFVHSEILAAKSQPIRSMITGVWKETTEKRIDLSEWDADTVGWFVQFLYGGDYKIPEPALEGDGDGGVRTLGESLLLAHAKVYALAQYEDIQELKATALSRLKTVVEEADRRIFWGAHEEDVNVIKLFDYVSSHTDCLVNSKEPMRDLVSSFVANNFDRLIGMEEMKAIVVEGGDFVAELMEKVIEKNREERRRIDLCWDELEESRIEIRAKADEKLAEAAERISGMQREIGIWKDRVTALDDRIHRLKIVSAQEVNDWKKEATKLSNQVQELEFNNTWKDHETSRLKEKVTGMRVFLDIWRSNILFAFSGIIIIVGFCVIFISGSD